MLQGVFVLRIDISLLETLLRERKLWKRKSIRLSLEVLTVDPVILKAKKRSAESSNFDLPNKRSKKGGGKLPSNGKCTNDRKAKKNHAHFDKSICTGSREKLQKKHHLAPVNREAVMSKRKPPPPQKNSSISQAQFEGRGITLSPFVERHLGPPPLHEVGNIWLPHPGVSSIACPNRPHEISNSMNIQHRNGTLHAPLYFRPSTQQRQQRVAFPSSCMPGTASYPHPEVPNGVPRLRNPRGDGTGFR